MSKREICWVCGKREAVTEVYGYPVCEVCKKKGIDPEELEMVVIESVEEGRIVPYEEIKRRAEYCDVCGREIGSDYIIDNDVLMCSRCFLKVYKKSIEDLIGVVVVIENERGGE